jgi:hypothetical protein
LGATVSYQPLVEHTDPQPQKTGTLLSLLSLRLTSPKNHSLIFLPRGFAQMTVIDLEDFNRQTYRFEYVRREFLGDLRCLLFDVSPVDKQKPGKFLGRIWVEDRDNAIVRFNGTYIAGQVPKGASTPAAQTGSQRRSMWRRKARPPRIPPSPRRALKPNRGCGITKPRP